MVAGRTDWSDAPLRWCILWTSVLAWFAGGCGWTDSPQPLQLLDVTGEAVNPLDISRAKARVFLFTRADCPISNRYAPEVHRLCRKFGRRGVEFCLVYPDPEQTPQGIRQHMKLYGYECAALLDPKHELVALSGASITPEAAVFVPAGRMVYRGRIDDWYVDWGKSRARATSRDLESALEAVLDGRPVENARTKAVGCYISDLKPPAE